MGTHCVDLGTCEGEPIPFFERRYPKKLYKFLYVVETYVGAETGKFKVICNLSYRSWIERN